jgi:hypothetical protein
LAKKSGDRVRSEGSRYNSRVLDSGFYNTQGCRALRMLRKYTGLQRISVNHYRNPFFGFDQEK